MNNNWWCENIRATNPCVTADTWVQTDAGPRQVAQLIGQPFVARLDGADHATTSEGFFLTDTKPVVRLHSAEGFSLRLTSDHRVRRVTRSTRWSSEVEWCAAGALQPGDRVVLNNHRSNASWPGAHTRAEGYLLGLLMGDGVLKEDKAVLSVWAQTAVANGASAGVSAGTRALMQEAEEAARTLPHRADFAGWQTIAGRGEYRLSLAALKSLAQSLGMSPGSKTITAALEQASSECYRGFLRGFFDADGSVQGNQDKGVSARASIAIGELKV
jgi:ribonucleoside-diphosphate reductase alpha chain